MKTENQYSQDGVSSDMKMHEQDEVKAPQYLSIGALLREERKKKGLSYEKVAEIIRLRPSIIEAMENESWQSLPAPVFVSGFIRSYGKALGLKEEKLMAVFRNSCPVDTACPRPLTEPVKSKKGLCAVLIILILVAGLAYFLWKGYLTFARMKDSQVPVPQTTEVVPDSVIATDKIPAETQVIPEAPLAEENVAASSVTNSGRDATPDLANADKPQTLPEQAPIPLNDAQAKPPETTAQRGLTLKAAIRERTWVRIFVDDQEPREYMFGPNENILWTGKKGFELLIGNAGGIDLMLNGQQIKIPGSSGQVIRLNIPGDYRRRQVQD